jgi:trans-aconitate methyltransferase
MDSKQQTVDTYNRSADALARKFNQLERSSDIHEAFSHMPKQNPRVVEIGCGNGRDAKGILEYTADYEGFDISPAMIALAQEQAPGGTFKVADLEEYEFERPADIVFAFASLLHSDKSIVKQVFDKVHAALNADGLFFISLKNEPYTMEHKVDEFGTRTFYYYTPQDIKDFAGAKYRVLWQNELTHGKQRWIYIIFQKITAVG